MKRILVLGSGGAGKSTFCRQLSEKIDLPVIHLDSYFWNSGWVETPKDEWVPLVCELSKRSEWIMDGNYSGTIDLRMKHADTVIFLDYNRLTCTLGVLKRVITNYGRVRCDMPEGCHERFSLEFMKWIWNYPSRSRLVIMNAIFRAPSSVSIHIIKRRSDLKELMQSRLFNNNHI